MAKNAKATKQTTAHSDPWWIDLVDEDAPKYFDPEYLRKEVARLQVEGRRNYLDAAVSVLGHAIAYLAEAGRVDGWPWVETRGAVAELIRSVFEYDLSREQIIDTQCAVNRYMGSHKEMIRQAAGEGDPNP